MAEIEVRAESWGWNMDFLIEDGGTAVDISAATTKNLIFKRGQQGSQFIVENVSFKTNGTDGYLRWTPNQGDLDRKYVGIWTVEAEIRGITNWNGPTRPASFVVLDRLQR